jgi:2-keto-4-pentenoate hydratase/2-oxohepta-3-ene-1,7-dioic acid hydratase in catechol pathway
LFVKRPVERVSLAAGHISNWSTTMRIARYEQDDLVRVGYYHDSRVTALADAASFCAGEFGKSRHLRESADLLDFLPPDGPARSVAIALSEAIGRLGEAELEKLAVPTDRVRMLIPIPRPNAIFLLAGNYAAHIEEGGKQAAARQETFPYVFMKPPTTLTHPGSPVKIPAVSPRSIDWECELGVIIGRTCKGVSEHEALSYVAGYTVVNDISDRKFRPNAERVNRDKDQFFDWQHGKWHDTFCPVGPCVRSAETLADPQSLTLELRVNGQVRQHASTGQMIFPVAAIIAFLSSFVTLEPGDIISTGTPSGVGAASGTFLKSGDVLEAEIGGIGRLRNPVV